MNHSKNEHCQVSSGKHKTNYTINDIANMANVSRGTVDRVIHGRGTVSKKASEKVNLVLNKIDYKPNLIAQTLKKGELFKIASLIPDYNYDIYWKNPLNGIEKVKGDYSAIGVSINNYLFNPYDPNDFRHKAEIILKQQYDGLLVAPFFYREAIDFFKKCDMHHLPYISFNTHLEDANIKTHVGQDLVQSGRVAAELMEKLLPENKKLLIIHIDEDLSDSIHMQKKENGFKSFFQNINSGTEVLILRTNPEDNPESIILNALSNNPDIKGIYVSTSKVYLVAKVLEKQLIKKVLIGYDLIDDNIRYLKSGMIDFLIFQNPEYQAGLGISYLIDHLIFKKEIPSIKLLPIEIVTKENHVNYLK